MNTTATLSKPNKVRMPGALRAALWGGLLCIFAIPVIAKAIDPGTLWTGGDFLVAAIGLGLLGLLLEGGYHISDRWSYRLAAMGAALTSFLLVWINLAVGFIGNENNPINQLYLAMPVFALVAGMLVRFRARGMAAIMALMAAAQIIIAIIGQPEQMAVWRATFVFAGAWSLSAILFRVAGRR